MTRPLALVALALCCITHAVPVFAQEADTADTGADTTEAGAEDPRHQELRELRDGLVKATKDQDIDGMLAFLTDDVVVTFMDGEQCTGKDEVRAYFERMLQGDDRIVEAYSVDVEVADLTKFYDENTGGSYGTATSRFDLTDGREFTVTGPWTAMTRRTDDGQWRIAAFHSSANMFNNPILDMVKQYMIWVGIAALVIGFILGLAIAAFFRRGKARTETKPAA